MRLGLIPLLVALGVAALDAQPACRPSRFGDAVSHGQAYERPLAPDLVFRLAPSGHPANPPGWTIEVRSRTLPEPENELSWVVTPPYRFWNPRYLDTGYDWSARDAVDYGRREFGFVTTAADYLVAAEAVRKLLWSTGLTEPELVEARRALDSVRRATGRLVILDSRVDEKAASPHGVGAGSSGFASRSRSACLEEAVRQSPLMPQADAARRRELGVAGLLIGLAIAIVVLGLQIPPGVQTDPLGPRVFPLALGAAIGLCGVLLAVTTLAPGRFTTAMPVFVESGGDDDSAPAGTFSPGRLVAAIGITAAYVAAFEPLGYLVATPLYVAALAVVHGGVSRRALVAAPVLLAAAFYAAFRFGLLIPVPDGILERWIPW